MPPDDHAGAGAEQALERQAAVRALLRRPVLPVDHPRFPLVRRHADALRDLFRDETGWALTVDAEVARLRKSPPATVDASRPATDRHGTPFTRRRYVLLCLALAVLERAESQATLGWLADALLAEAADVHLGIAFDLADREERSDLVAVVRLLLDLRVLARVAGDEQAYVDATGDALYDVDRRVLGRLLAVDRGPSTVAAEAFEERLAALVDRPVLDAADARARAARRELGRRLLDDPVTYVDDLGDRELEYLRTQRAATLRRLAEASGFEPEVRAEGMALLDPTGEATDVGLPEDGTDGHVTLLVAEHLAAAARRAHGRDGGRAAVPAGGHPLVAEADVRAHVAHLVAVHGHRWRQAARQDGAEHALTAIALARLAELGLVERDEDRVRVRPAIHRFAAEEPTVAGSAAVQEALP